MYFQPDRTLRHFFQEIADKNGYRELDVAQFFTPELGQTGPELLRLILSSGDLAVYGVGSVVWCVHW